jgi:hypothetical protein
MKAKSAILVILFLSFVISGVAQEDKNPVAENDYAATRVLQTIEIPVLENDFAYDGHPFKVIMAVGGSHGIFYKTDTSIIYTPGLSCPIYSATDSISYSIIDLENNLFSDFAKVYIEISNDGSDILDINQVSCRINAFGMQFWDLESDHASNYEVPAGLGISSIFNQALWIGGLDEAGELSLAAERYRIVGTDFYSGPVMDSLSYSNDQDVQWHKVWKLSKEDISFHLQHWQDAGYEPVENIQQWPGTGDTSLGQAHFLALYYDRDGDGIYNPLNGDCPIIKGDQAIFVLNNDDRGPHLESGGKKLGVEIQTLYYAFEAPDDSALKFTTFADQRIINRSNHSYHNVFTGHFLDFDLGYAYDDFFHCDTTLQSAICYNGEAMDGQGNVGEYGDHPPAQSFTCLNYKMNGFVYFFTWAVPQPMLDPENDLEYYNYLHGFWRDLTPVTLGGNGYGGELPVKYIFTGDPVTGTGWTELDSPLGPGDRKGLISTGPFDFTPGDTIHLEYALVYARDLEGDNLSSITFLKNRIQQVHDFYQNSLGTNNLSQITPKIDIYPNPCKSELFVKISYTDPNTQIDFFIFDLLGSKVQSGKINGDEFSIFSISDLAPGFYLIKFVVGQNSVTKKFIREDF